MQVLGHGCKKLVTKTWKMISTVSDCFPSNHKCLVLINPAGSRRLKVRGGINAAIFVHENENRNRGSVLPTSCENPLISKVKAENLLRFFPP